MAGRHPQAIFIMACILSVCSFALAGFGSGHLLTLCRSRTNRRKGGKTDPHLLFELHCHITCRNPLTDPRVDQEARPQANTRPHCLTQFKMRFFARFGFLERNAPFYLVERSNRRSNVSVDDGRICDAALTFTGKLGSQKHIGSSIPHCLRQHNSS